MQAGNNQAGNNQAGNNQASPRDAVNSMNGPAYHMLRGSLIGGCIGSIIFSGWNVAVADTDSYQNYVNRDSILIFISGVVGAAIDLGIDKFRQYRQVAGSKPATDKPLFLPTLGESKFTSKTESEGREGVIAPKTPAKSIGDPRQPGKIAKETSATKIFPEKNEQLREGRTSEGKLAVRRSSEPSSKEKEPCRLVEEPCWDLVPYVHWGHNQLKPEPVDLSPNLNQLPDIDAFLRAESLLKSTLSNGFSKMNFPIVFDSGNKVEGAAGTPEQNQCEIGRGDDGEALQASHLSDSTEKPEDMPS